MAFDIRIAGTAELDFVHYELEEPKYDTDECRQRGMTYAAPMRVTLRLTAFEVDPDTGATRIDRFTAVADAAVVAAAPGLADDLRLDDVRVAVANIARARAALRGARSDRLPQGEIGAGANYGRNPEGQRPYLGGYKCLTGSQSWRSYPRHWRRFA